MLGLHVGKLSRVCAVVLWLASASGPRRTKAAEASCGFVELQLAGCNTDCGRVEVRFEAGGEWQGLVIRPWTLSEARLACRAAGFAEAASAAEAWTTRSERLVGARLPDVATDFAMVELGDAIDDAAARGVGVSCRTGPRDEESDEDRWASELIAQWPSSKETFGVSSTTTNSSSSESSESSSSSSSETSSSSRFSPFSEESLRRAFVFADDLADEWRRLDDAYREHVFKEMDVASTTAVGVSDGPRIFGGGERDAHARWLLNNDPPLPEPAPGPGIAAALIRDGVAQVLDFGLTAAELDSLEADARAPFSFSSSHDDDDDDHPDGGEKQHGGGGRSLHPNVSSSSGGRVATARIPLPTLEAWLLRNDTVKEALETYLGSSVVFDGYKATYLRGLESADDYIASLWHHDRVGRRLKLFLFLHDVDCDAGHPTKIAKGTHRLTYFKADTFPSSRFKDDFVSDTFDVHVACGRRGGGFLFDTHTIHKGTPEGSDDRLTIIAEFHAKAKCPTARVLGLQLPCPSGDQWPVLHPATRFLRGA